MSAFKRLFRFVTYTNPFVIPFTVLFIDFALSSAGGPSLSMKLREREARNFCVEISPKNFDKAVEEEIAKRKEAGTL